MRSAFIDELVLAAEGNEKIVLIVGDLGYGAIEPFANRFPKRFFNAGVAEQNMMGMAAGLASEGFHVFVYSIANFPTFRCAEQIRNDVDYHCLTVTIVAVGGGLSYGSLGYSHHAVQDYALMRTMPNMLISAPGDPLEVRACMRYILNNPQPSYLRLGKVGETCIHASVPEIHPGKWLCVGEGGGDYDDVYLTTGTTLDLVHQLQVKAPHFRHYSMPMWGMQFKEFQVGQLENFLNITTVEDHLIDGGFGSWLMEAISVRPELLPRIKIKAIDAKICGMVGKQLTLNLAGGLSEELICA